RAREEGRRRLQGLVRHERRQGSRGWQGRQRRRVGVGRRRDEGRRGRIIRRRHGQVVRQDGRRQGELRRRHDRRRRGMTQRETIRSALVDAARAIGAPEVEPVVERPRDSAHGEWATSLALTLARPLKAKPREIAERLVEHLDLSASGIAGVEIAGPGFINFRMRADATAAGLASIIAADESYGRGDAGAGKQVVVEFVSANPTGPLHVGHGRQAALGDAIASLLEWTGWTVSREFYYNDAGVQIANLGASVLAR